MLVYLCMCVCVSRLVTILMKSIALSVKNVFPVFIFLEKTSFYNFLFLPTKQTEKTI